MTTTLTSPPVREMLERLFRAAQDDVDVADRLAQRAGRGASEVTAQRRADLLADVYMPISPEAGRLLYALVRAVKPATVVEFGTSHAISTIHLAAAVRDNGRGRVVTTEMSADKVQRARANLADCGLSDVVTVLEGDALETLVDAPASIDLLFLDGWKDLCLPVLRLLEPRLTSGALVLADDVTAFPGRLGDYLAYVRDPSNGYVSVEFAVGDGVELSCRI